MVGGAGFVGSSLSLSLHELEAGLVLVTDNFSRKGCDRNLTRLASAKIDVFHSDVRCPNDLKGLPRCDWIIDAAANPSVLAGVGNGSSLGVIESNLVGTMHLLELAKHWGAGFILLSTSRVYSMSALRDIPIHRVGARFVPVAAGVFPEGASMLGIGEDFSTSPPLSLYGSTKRASELLATEYAYAYRMPVWINRCGVMAGAGQMGGPQQGIISYWIHAVREKKHLRFTGYGGYGLQVRDIFHPADMVEALLMQMQKPPLIGTAPVTVFGGGATNSVSLQELHQWCEERWGSHPVEQIEEAHIMDIPWMVMNTHTADERFGWRVKRNKEDIFEEIAEFADGNENWLSKVL